jgi:hypothetical protein
MHSFTCGPYTAFHELALTCHIKGRMNTPADVSNYIIVTISIIIILSTPVLGGVEVNLHFPVPSMNRFNQTELAIILILPCWAFFRDYFCLLYCTL